VSAGWLLLHEIGHYFDLRHTHGDLGITLPNQSLGQNSGDDKVDDTIKDLAKWIATILPHTISPANTSSFSPAKGAGGRDHGKHHVLSFSEADCEHTETPDRGQLDRWADTTLDFYRQKVCDGRTRFVDRQTPGNEGTSTYPYDSVNRAVTAADSNGGDIILLRPGAYDEAVTISKPVTIRTTRKGPASIGTSIMPAESSEE
jgi:hypothetical protein